MADATHIATPAPTIAPRDHRRTRHIKRNVKLHSQIRDLITANAACRYIGGNFAVEAIANRLGFLPHDLAIADVRIGRRIITLIVVPHRIWDRAFPSAKCIDLRFQARQEGYAAILVPQAVIEREPRLGNSRLLARTATIKVDATSRMLVLAHLIENGASCIFELAGLIQHQDPIGAILHLVTTGVIAIDMGSCVTPYTMADIASPHNLTDRRKFMGVAFHATAGVAVTQVRISQLRELAPVPLISTDNLKGYTPGISLSKG